MLKKLDSVEMEAVIGGFNIKEAVEKFVKDHIEIDCKSGESKHTYDKSADIKDGKIQDKHYSQHAEKTGGSCEFKFKF